MVDPILFNAGTDLDIGVVPLPAPAACQAKAPSPADAEGWAVLVPALASRSVLADVARLVTAGPFRAAGRSSKAA